MNTAIYTAGSVAPIDPQTPNLAISNKARAIPMHKYENLNVFIGLLIRGNLMERSLMCGQKCFITTPPAIAMMERIVTYTSLAIKSIKLLS
jgi:hypothetical protein